jgi:integrase
MANGFIKYVLVYDRKHEAATKGKASVQVRAYDNKRAKYFGTGVVIPPDKWNAKKGEPKDPILCAKCQSLINSLQEFENRIRYQNGVFTLTDFALWIEAQKPKAVQKPLISFTRFLADELHKEKLEGQTSWKYRRCSIELFKEFKADVTLSEINYSLIRDFNHFLTLKGFAINTIDKIQRHLRKYVNLAIKAKLLPHDQNPYLDFKLKTEQAKADFLTSDELTRFEALMFGPEQWFLEKVRDMFLFSCYTGLRFSDVYALTKKNFEESEEGLILNFRAKKTQKDGRKFLHSLFDGKPQKIARKYWPDNDQRLFKGVMNHKANKALKTLAKLATIDKALTFKDSRDTFGTQFMEKSKNPRLTQKELQHSNLRTTEKYLHMTEQGHKQALKEIKW